VLLRRLVPLVLALAAAIALAPSCAPRSGAAGPSAPSAFATSRPPTPGVTVTPSPSAIKPIPDGFRIQIPRLAIDLPIAEGVIQRDIDQQQTPEGFAFHLPGTSTPGERGNTYVYSHARVGMFLALWNAQVGDEVLVSTPDGRKLTYVVTEVRAKVPPTDISVAQPTDDERLTLQTSTGPRPEDPRFVVIALIKR
jgi:LPXTG-site transpeptidase (sortase) family protein